MINIKIIIFKTKNSRRKKGVHDKHNCIPTLINFETLLIILKIHSIFMMIRYTKKKHYYYY